MATLRELGRFCCSNALLGRCGQPTILLVQSPRITLLRTFRRGNRLSEIDSRLVLQVVGFTVAFSGASFLGCAIWGHERRRRMASMEYWKDWESRRNNMSVLRRRLSDSWARLSEGQQVFVPICVLNVLVFIAWRVPALRATMRRYFVTSTTSSTVCWPLVLSTFSHITPIHLGVNMFALHSFCTIAVHSLGKEQFLGLYLSAGAVSSMASYLLRIYSCKNSVSLGAVTMLGQFSYQHNHETICLIVAPLWESGAIFTIVAYVCMKHPDLKLSIVFLPFFTFTAGNAIKALMILDAVGVMLSWQYLDHVAHLSGALFGLWWYYWGSKHIWQKRYPYLLLWDRILGRKF